MCWRAPRPWPLPETLLRYVPRSTLRRVFSSFKARPLPPVRAPWSPKAARLCYRTFVLVAPRGYFSAPPCALPPSPSVGTSGRAGSRDVANPLTPTTTPLHGRVAENPHIAYRHHGHESMTRERDEGRAVVTLFVGSAAMPSPTGSAWRLRGVVLGAKAPAPVAFIVWSFLADEICV